MKYWKSTTALTADQHHGRHKWLPFRKFYIEIEKIWFEKPSIFFNFPTIEKDECKENNVMLKNQCRLAFTRSYVQYRPIKTQYYNNIKVRLHSNSKTVKYGISSTTKGGIFSSSFKQKWVIESNKVYVSILSSYIS